MQRWQREDAREGHVLAVAVPPPTSGVDRGVGHGLFYTSSSVVGEQRRICRASRASERVRGERVRKVDAEGAGGWDHLQG